MERVICTVDLLRKKDLHPEVGVAKSTVADWIEDFNIYIPQSKQGNITYYQPETIDVLNFIKKCREQSYQKQQIMEALANNGFPVTIEEAKEDANKLIYQYGNQENNEFLTVMQTMGQAVHKLSNQDESIKGLQNKGLEHEGRMDEIEEWTEKTDETVNDLKQEIELLRKELVASQQEKKRQGFWSRLFNKN